ncbi:MAG: family transcriptional regulator, cyclic receptor protein [Pseudonocardiales bacterium]|jgi:CRP/FNR family transcriptional regulator|nr:family transcriptional regulator, cyclic receptor protein [Pseudonocardiales bacterium]MDT4958007.1 family transcriptional regulator, cyclic receptor protein [Pseudonocardiales bacterium]
MLADRYRTAFKHCRLATLSDATLDKLTHGSTFLDVPADGTVMRFGSTEAYVAVVIDGFLRTYLNSPAGRQLTVRYMRPGDIVGATGIFTAPIANLAVQAITDSSLLVLRPDTVRALAREDVALANVLLVDIAERASAYISALAHTTLSSLRQNVVRHLLDLAMRDPSTARLVVRLSQQELADYAGTVREVVGRILRDLKDEQLVTTGRDEVVLLDPERLHDITWPRVY